MAGFRKIKEKCKEVYAAVNEIKELAEKNSNNIQNIHRQMDEILANNIKNNLEVQEDGNENLQENTDKSIRMSEFQVRQQEGVSRLERAGSIKKEHLEGCVVLADRKAALEIIPKNGIAA